MAERAHLSAGDVVKATVTAVEPYGVHLSHCGIEVLVHVTDLEWAKSFEVQEHVRVGDELNVTILRIVSDTDAAGWLPPPSDSTQASSTQRSRPAAR